MVATRVALMGMAITALGAMVTRQWIMALEQELLDIANGVRAMGADPDAVRLRIHGVDEVGALVQSLDELRASFRDALGRERQMRHALERADRAKDTFLLAVRHELRTPLNAILGFADVLLSDIDGPLTEAQREDTRIIASAGQHLSDLFDDVLDLSAAVSRQLELTMERVDLVPILQAVIAEQRPQAREHNLALVLETPDELWLIGDPKRLRQIFTNLVSNAVKFTDEGRVHVTATSEPGPTDRARVTVLDTGVGIESSALINIFDEFLQAPPPVDASQPDLGRRRARRRLARRPRRRPGTGLGLAIVRRLVEAHQGTVTVESQVGQGSTFCVELPVAQPSLAGLTATSEGALRGETSASGISEPP